MKPPFQPPRLTLWCCGKRGCPEITQNSDGFVLSDKGKAIDLTDRQASELAAWVVMQLGNKTQAAE